MSYLVGGKEENKERRKTKWRRRNKRREDTPMRGDGR